MSVRQALLALLSEGPMYGYQLRSEFEQRTGATWPLNVGQVYQTLTRLERDDLVVVVGHGGADDDHEATSTTGEADATASGADRGQVSYAITRTGLAEVDAWFTAPVARDAPPRDELAIKLAIAVTLPGVDIGQLVQAQRTATMSALQAHVRAKRTAEAAPDTVEGLAGSLVLESLVFDAEAEIRWLDHCEARLRRVAAHRSRPAGQPSTVTVAARGSATITEGETR